LIRNKAPTAIEKEALSTRETTTVRKAFHFSEPKTSYKHILQEKINHNEGKLTTVDVLRDFHSQGLLKRAYI